MIWFGVFFFWIVPALVVLEIGRYAWLEYRKDRVPILLYHRLISRAEATAGEVADDEMIWVCYAEEFARQMGALAANGWTTISLDEYLAIREGRSRRPPKPVVITFDDGYESNYKYAFPALRANRQRATIFVALEPDEHTRSQIAGVDGFLSPEQMREMTEAGIDIQSHTLTHCVLTELADAQARYELSESRKRIFEITGKTVDHIAIPRAGYDRRIRKLVRQEGYLTACSNAKGSSTGLSNPLALPRIVIEREMSLSDFLSSLEPRSGLMLRIVGNIKRIPERLGGATFARRVRNVLYDSLLGSVFAAHRLKRILVGGALLYCAMSAAFTWWMLAR